MWKNFWVVNLPWNDPYILYYQQSNHYQPILNLTAALGSQGSCTLCNVTYTLAIEHRCSRQCPRCKSAECAGDEENIRYCRDCNRRFFGNACLAQHKKPNSARLREGGREASVCQVLQKCRVCSYLVRTNSRRKHVCGMAFCSTCMQLRPYSHACFIAPLRKKKNSDSSDPNAKNSSLYFIFYDFEIQQHGYLPGDASTRVHQPNLCVAQRMCTACLENEEIAEDCGVCGKREFIFKQDPVGQLVKLATGSKKVLKTVCIAHNARDFHVQFIPRYLAEKAKTQIPTLIMSGTKIISMRVGRVSFLDSLNELPMSLSALPKTFGFADSTTKGTFPHLFNTPENQNCVGPLPSILITGYHACGWTRTLSKLVC